MRRGWKPGPADEALVGTKPEKPVVVGIIGWRRPWFEGTGARGPRALAKGLDAAPGVMYTPVCWLCGWKPIGTGDDPAPRPDCTPNGIAVGAPPPGGAEGGRIFEICARSSKVAWSLGGAAVAPEAFVDEDRGGGALTAGASAGGAAVRFGAHASSSNPLATGAADPALLGSPGEELAVLAGFSAAIRSAAFASASRSTLVGACAPLPCARPRRGLSTPPAVANRLGAGLVVLLLRGF